MMKHLPPQSDVYMTDGIFWQSLNGTSALWWVQSFGFGALANTVCIFSKQGESWWKWWMFQHVMRDDVIASITSMLYLVRENTKSAAQRQVTDAGTPTLPLGRSERVGPLSPVKNTKGYIRAGSKRQAISYLFCTKVVKSQKPSKSTKIVLTQI